MPLKSSLLAKIQSHQGQSMVESLALTTALMAFLSILGAVIYFGFVHIGMNYLLHEFLVCQSTSGEKNCRDEFYKKSAPMLFAAKVLRFESSDLSGKKKAQLILQMPLKRTMILKKDLDIYR